MVNAQSRSWPGPEPSIWEVYGSPGLHHRWCLLPRGCPAALCAAKPCLPGQSGSGLAGGERPVGWDCKAQPPPQQANSSKLPRAGCRGSMFGVKPRLSEWLRRVLQVLWGGTGGKKQAVSSSAHPVPDPGPAAPTAVVCLPSPHSRVSTWELGLAADAMALRACSDSRAVSCSPSSGPGGSAGAPSNLAWAASAMWC